MKQTESPSPSQKRVYGRLRLDYAIAGEYFSFLLSGRDRRRQIVSTDPANGHDEQGPRHVQVIY